MRSKSEAKEAAIVNAAQDAFLQKGIKRSTISGIAQAAGVATGTVYLYFADKDALVLACARKYAAEHMAQIEKVLAAKTSPAIKLKKYILGRYDNWQKFGAPTGPAKELAEAIIRLDPDGIKNASANVEKNIARLLQLCRDELGWQVDPTKDARKLFISYMSFFPVATDTQAIVPSRKELVLMIDWHLAILSGAQK